MSWKKDGGGQSLPWPLSPSPGIPGALKWSLDGIWSSPDNAVIPSSGVMSAPGPAKRDPCLGSGSA